MKRLHRFLLPGLLLVIAGCGPVSATPDAGPATFTQIYAELFPVHQRAQCNYCHSNPPNNLSNGNLSMGSDKAAAYAALVGKMSAGTKCAGHSLVVPGHPEESLLYLKSQEPPPCGGRMPLGGDQLTDTQLEMVRTWIAAGALDN
jgi:mono/diheme cytochrome c family protein